MQHVLRVPRHRSRNYDITSQDLPVSIAKLGPGVLLACHSPKLV
jgi:hypothetical protein